MTGYQGHGRRVLAVREGDAGVAGRGQCGGHARDYLIGDPGGDQLGNLLRPAAEKVRVAALQADDRLSFPGGRDHPPVDLLLRQAPTAVRVTEADQLGLGPGVLQQVGVDQVIVQHQVGQGQGIQATDCDQVRIAGAGPTR